MNDTTLEYFKMLIETLKIKEQIKLVIKLSRKKKAPPQLKFVVAALAAMGED